MGADRMSWKGAGMIGKRRATGRSRLGSDVRLASLLAALLFVSPAHADPLSTAARGEIEALLSRLAASGCQFQRNGTWYTAAEAQAHLQRKLDYLADRGAVATAEQFIERAATKSSMSGQAYRVKCGPQPAVPSSRWLYPELQALRDAGSGTKTDR
jgi:hypothetical protein